MTMDTTPRLQVPVWTQERVARAALLATCGAGEPGLSALVHDRGAAEVWHALSTSQDDRAWVRRAHQLDPQSLPGNTAAAGARFVIPGDAEWPSALADLDQVTWQRMGGEPLGLWLRGRGSLPQCLGQPVAIVGSRACSSYGQAMASDLAAELALPDPGSGQPPRCIVSGGAYGIDLAAHRAAVAVQGHTVAVLASGVDRPYPVAHAPLFEQIASGCVLVSECPPGAHPTKPGFLQRNRLIAALSVGVVVVEAGVRSGALNTISWANALGRVAMAVPGPVTSSLSQGPHRLIRDAQAVLVRDARDVAQLLGPTVAADPIEPRPARPWDGMDEHTLAVHECLPSRGGLRVDEVVSRTGLSAGTVLAALEELREAGLIALALDGRWRVDRA